MIWFEKRDRCEKSRLHGLDNGKTDRSDQPGVEKGGFSCVGTPGGERLALSTGALGGIVPPGRQLGEERVGDSLAILVGKDVVFCIQGECFVTDQSVGPAICDFDGESVFPCLDERCYIEFIGSGPDDAGRFSIDRNGGDVEEFSQAESNSRLLFADVRKEGFGQFKGRLIIGQSGEEADLGIVAFLPVHQLGEMSFEGRGMIAGLLKFYHPGRFDPDGCSINGG